MLHLVGLGSVPIYSFCLILGAVVSTESTASARIIQRRLPVPREYYDQKGIDTGEANPIPVGNRVLQWMHGCQPQSAR